MDNDINISVYKREDDIEELNKNKEEKYDNPLLKTDFQTFITEEMSEPDISYWCNDSPEATQLLRKCIKMMNEKNFATMKSYLKTISDFEGEINNVMFKTSDGSNTEPPVNKVSFVKNFYLGIAHFKEGEYEEALECFKQAKSLHQYYQLHYNLALCCMKLGNLYDAIIYLDCVITKNPNFFFAYYNLIKIYLTNRNPSQAYVNYRRLSDLIKKEKDKEKLSAQIDLNSNTRLSITSFNVLKLFYKLGAECSFHLEYHQECVHTLLEALKFNPEDPELWCLYGKVFILKKSFDYAKPLIERAIELDPEYTEAKELLKIINTVLK